MILIILIEGNLIITWNKQIVDANVIVYDHLLNKVKHEAMKEALKDLGNFNNLIDVRTKTLLLQYIHDDNHFLNDFLEKCPSTETHGAEIL